MAQALKVKKTQEGLRLDKLLADVYEGASFGLVQKLCRTGQIRVDGKRVKGREKVLAGQEIRIPPILEHARPEQAFKISYEEQEDIKEWIIEESKDVLFLNKPYGLPCQAGTGHAKSIDRFLQAYYQDKGKKPRLVHRLDKTTTGLLMMALTRQRATELSKAFQSRKMEKVYWAIVKGKVKKSEGKIVTYMSKEEDEFGYERMQHTKEQVKGGEGKRAESHWRLIGSVGRYHWLEVKPKTGRMHQIRLHLSEELGTPIVGDVKYKGEALEGEVAEIPSGFVYLHARTIKHGEDENFPIVEAPLPEHFKKVFELFAWEESDAKEIV